MRTRSSSNLVSESFPNPTTSNSKLRNRRRSKQPFSLEESPLDTMADQRTMTELLCAPTEGYVEAIMVPPILSEHFKLKHNLLCACPHHGFAKFHQFGTFYNALNPTDQDSLNSVAGGNLLERRTQDVLTIIENKSKVRNSRNKSIVSQVKSSDVNSSSSSEIAKITHAVNQQTSAVTTAMTAILKQFQATSPPASVKAMRKFVLLAVVLILIITLAYTLGSKPLPSNTIANPKGKLKAITIQSGLVLDGPFVHMPPPFINLEEDEHAEETLTDPKLAEYSIKVPHPLVQKAKPPSLRNYAVHQRDPHLGANINLIPLSGLKKLGLPDLISTHMTLELSNQAICTPARIARDVFVPVRKFTFHADFIIVDYESDPRVPLISGIPFLRTARALIDVHKEEMILCGGDERLTLNVRHDTLSYSNQPHKESINMIDIYNDSYEDYLKNLFATNHLSGNPTFSSHTDLTSSEVTNPLSGNTTSSSLDHFLKEFANELILITFLPRDDDISFDIEFELREIEYLLNHYPTKEMDSILEDSIDVGNLSDPNNDLVGTIPEMFTDEHTLYYLSPPLYDDEDKIKESKLLIDELDPPRSSDCLPSLECDSFLYEDFSKIDALPSTNNEDTVFNPEVLGSKNLLSFSSEIKEKFSTPGFSLLKEFMLLFSWNYLIGALKLSKSLKFLKARWRFFLALMERTSIFWMFRVSISIPHEQLDSEDFLDFEDSCSWFYPSITRSSQLQLYFRNPIS
nr:hypothetical protein [Tanacetum cinerariifolium]